MTSKITGKLNIYATVADSGFSVKGSTITLDDNNTIITTTANSKIAYAYTLDVTENKSYKIGSSSARLALFGIEVVSKQ